MGRLDEYCELKDVPVGARIHIVGIGGSGMSAIARVLLEQGHYRVSGSDRALSEVGRSLAGLGAEVFDGHRAEQAAGADVVFVSSAIPPDNVEVQAARAQGIPVVKRPQVLTWLTRPYQTIAVAGTHGKTTTTGMVAHVLLRAGLDPSFVIGGIVLGLGTNARVGQGPHFVIEADEYDRTFLALRPSIAVVTNVEMDHPDCYPTYADVQAAFAAFVGQTAEDGCVAVCGDDAGARALVAQAGGRRAVTYGLGSECTVRAVDVHPQGSGCGFELVSDGKSYGQYSLQVPGQHNVRNALAAWSVARDLGVDEGTVREALAVYRGAARRFEIKGEVGGVTVIDDYAHHPTKIRATLAAARQRFAGRRIWAVYQPHTYSRTLALLAEYQQSFADADHVLVVPIFASRERDTLGISSKDLVSGAPHKDMRCVDSLDEAVLMLARNVNAGDVVVIMGAGDSYRVGEGLLLALQEKGK